MCLVIEIASHQVAVERLSEPDELVGGDRPLEFDDEQMAADFAGSFGVKRAGRKIAHSGTDRLGSGGHRALDLLAGQMLAKSG